MDLGTAVALLLLLALAYWGVGLVRRTLARYAGDLHTALLELKKTKTALADAGRGLRTSASDARGLRLRAELAEDGRGRAEARAEAADAQVAQLRERLGRADGRLAALQEAAQESVMRWDSPHASGGGRFGGSERMGAGGKETNGAAMGMRRHAMQQLRRAPLESTFASDGPRTSNGLLPEAYLLAQRPDLAESDSEDDSDAAGASGGDDAAWRRRPARPPAVTVPPPRRRRTPVTTSSSSSPPPRARGKRGGGSFVAATEDASGDADSEGGEAARTGRVLAKKGLVGAELRSRRERIPLSTSESSSLSSLSTGGGGRVGGLVADPTRGVVELAPGRWPRSSSASMGFRTLASDELVGGGGDS